MPLASHQITAFWTAARDQKNGTIFRTFHLSAQSVHDQVCGQGGLLLVHSNFVVGQPLARLQRSKTYHRHNNNQCRHSVHEVSVIRSEGDPFPVRVPLTAR